MQPTACASVCTGLGEDGGWAGAGEFSRIAAAAAERRGWGVVDAYPRSLAGENRDALHLLLEDANLLAQLLGHFVLLEQQAGGGDERTVG